MRNNYWSCSKFADIIRGTQKPDYGTSKQWKEWRTEAKEKYPIRYWIVEEMFDKVQDFVYYPLDKLYNVKYWIINRYVTKTHALTSNLKKGDYWEYDTRILHCLFDELVNFVEIEKAWNQVVWRDEEREKYKAPGWAFGPFRTRTWRCPEAGIDYLNWEINDPQTKGTPQAESAQIILDLYVWWKHTRPNRPDPMDISGWSEYCDNYDIFDDERDPEESGKMIDTINVIELDYYNEDTEMLKKLIDIRTSLWT